MLEISMRPNTPRELLEHAIPVQTPAPDRTGRIGLQPAADYRHVQSHNHEQDVSCAPALAMRPIPKWASPCTPLAPPSAPRPSRILALTSSQLVCPPFDSTGSVGVQPAAESMHVERHRHVRHVLCAAARALRPIPSRPFPCKTVAPQTVAPRPASPYPPRALPHSTSLRLGSWRRRSTSR